MAIPYRTTPCSWWDALDELSWANEFNGALQAGCQGFESLQHARRSDVLLTAGGPQGIR